MGARNRGRSCVRLALRAFLIKTRAPAVEPARYGQPVGKVAVLFHAPLALVGADCTRGHGIWIPSAGGVRTICWIYAAGTPWDGFGRFDISPRRRQRHTRIIVPVTSSGGELFPTAHQAPAHHVKVSGREGSCRFLESLGAVPPLPLQKPLRRGRDRVVLMLAQDKKAAVGWDHGFVTV